MSDLVHRPVLGNTEGISSRRIRLSPLPEGCVVQVFGSDAGYLAKLADRATFSPRPNGPGQWYLVGEEPLSQAAFKELESSLPPGVSAVDQSHGRVRISIEGSAATQVLAKGTGANLAAMKIGDAATTLIGHIAAHVTRTDAERFELMPLRSFAQALWHDLTAMSAEFRD